jgi:outer membrane protein with beta-barrel domain
MTRFGWYVAVAFVSILFIPPPARAETLVVPWLGANSGSRVGSGAIDVGASAGTTVAGVIGFEVDFGYSPNFFGSITNNYVLTTIGNVVVAIPFDRTNSAGIRPYLTGGFGLVRARIDAPFAGYSVANNDFATDVGGGVMGFFGNHIGVRADLRYIRSLEDDASTSPFTQIDLGRLHYWRTSFGLVLR